MNFKTKYGMPIVKVLNYYPAGSPSLIVALEAIVSTAMEAAKAEVSVDRASEVCQHLHPGPAQGLACRQCFDVVEAGRMPSDAEIDANTFGTGMALDIEQEKVDTANIEANVAALLKLVTNDDPGAGS